MSDTVVERKIVEMEFNCKEFAKNVETSMDWIKQLKQSLNFENSAKGLSEIERASKGVTFDSMNSAIDGTKSNFNVMQEIAIGALRTIGSKITEVGTLFKKAFNTAQVPQGFSLYEQKMGSVQTIMTNANKSLAVTNKTLAELNDYSNKTIYKFSDMTQNLGKFTAAGIDLDTATKAIMGISNAAAAAGASTADAGRAMYNIAQAYGVGAMKLVDWKSMENANIATKDLKKTIIEAAVACGTLKEDANGVTRTLDGVEVNWKSMRETLSKGWFDTSVMNKVFGMYADTTTDIGKKAMAAAQDIKTFTQLIDVLKESIATGWSTGFEYIIGDFEQAKALWTTVGNLISGTFDYIARKQNFIIGTWSKFGGRVALIDALKNAFSNLYYVIKPVIEAMREVFPVVNARNLIELTEKLRDYIATLRISQSAMNNIKDTFTGLFSVVNAFGTIVARAISSLFGLDKPLKLTAENFLKFTGAIGRVLTRLSNAIKDSKTLEKIFTRTGQIFKVFGSLVVITINSIITKLNEYNFKQRLENAINYILALGGKIKVFASNVISYISKVMKSPAVQQAGSIFGKIKAGLKELSDALGPSGKALIIFGGIMLAFGLSIVVAVNTVKKGIFDLLKSFRKIPNMFSTIGSSFTSIANTFNEIFVKKNIGDPTLNFVRIATGITMLAGSFYLLSRIKPESLGSAIIAIGTCATAVGVLTHMLNDLELVGIGEKTSGITKIAYSLIGMSIAVSIIAKNDWHSILAATIPMASAMGGLVAILETMSHINSSSAVKSSIFVSFGVAMLLIGKAFSMVARHNWKNILASTVPMEAALLSIAGVIALLGKIDTKGISSLASGGAILLGALGLVVIGNAFSTIAKIPWKNIQDSFGYMEGAFWSLVVAVVALSALGTFTDGIGSLAELAVGATFIMLGVGLMAVGNGLATMAPGLKTMSEINLFTIAGGLATLAVALRLFTGLNSIVMYLGLGIGLIGASVGTFASALALFVRIFSKGDFATIASNLTLMAQGLNDIFWPLTLTLTVTSLAANKFFIFASALSIASTAFLLATAGVNSLVNSLIALSASALTNISDNIDIIAEAVEKFAVTALKISPILFVVGLAMAPLAYSIAVICTGVGLLGLAFVGLGAGISLASVGMLAFTTCLLKLNSEELTTLDSNLGTISKALLGVIAATAAFGVALIPLGAGLLALSIGAVKISLSTIGLGAGLALSAIGVLALGVALKTVENVDFDETAKGLTSFAVAGFKIGGAGVVMLVGSLGVLAMAGALTVFAKVVKATEAIVDPAFDKTFKLCEKTYQAGNDFILGLVQGIGGGLTTLVQLGASAGSMIIQGFRSVTGWHSPWSTMIQAGKDLVEGIVQGVSGRFDDTTTLMDELGNLLTLDIGNGLNFSSWDAFTDSVTGKLGDIQIAGMGADNVITQLMNDLNGLGASGITKNPSVNNAAKTWLEGHGYEYHNYRADDYDDTFGSFNLAEMFNVDTDELEDSITGIGDAASGASTELSEFEKYVQNLEQSIDEAGTSFGKFEVDFSTKSKDLLKNAERNIMGVSSWGTDMQIAAQKGLSAPILKELSELGPEGYDKLKAFLEMSAEEIEEYNNLYTESIENNKTSLIKTMAALATAGDEEAIQYIKDAGMTLDELNSDLDETAGYIFQTEQKFDDLSESIKGSIKQFEAFDFTAETTGTELASNLKSQFNGISQWTLDFMQLARKGLSIEVLKSLEDLGTEGYAKVRAFMQMSDEEIKEYNELYSKRLSLSNDSAVAIMASYALAGDEAAKAFIDAQTDVDLDKLDSSLGAITDKYFKIRDAAISVQETFSSLKETISNQISIFEEFNATTEITGDQMIINMESQIEGITKWSENLNSLAQRGISSELLKSLSELGPDGYAKVAAFVDMTDDQLMKANELYSKSLSLPDSATGEILSSYAKAGDETVKTFCDAIGSNYNDVVSSGQTIVEAMKTIGTQINEGLFIGIKDGLETVKDAGTLLAQTFEDAVREALDTHSPSRLMEDIGGWQNVGFVNGIRSKIEMVKDAAKEVTSAFTTTVKDGVLDIGNTMMNGITATPKITPIFDNSNAIRDARTLGSVISANQAAKYASQTQQANANARMYEYMGNQYAAMAKSISNAKVPVNVNVVLEGDAKGVFNMVRTENQSFTQSTGWNPLANPV